MSWNPNIIIIIVLLIGGVFLGFFGYTKWTNRCQEDDARICTLLDQLVIDSSTQHHGTYTEIHKTIPLFTIEWAIEGSSQEILKKESSDETMHLIIADDAVFLKDYSDNYWWKQSVQDVDKFDITLPFDPTIFFNNLVKDIQDPQTSLSYTHQDLCGARTCYVMTLKKDNMQITDFYIDEKSEQIQQIIISSSDIEQKILFDYEDFQIEIPHSSVKAASANQNIFFENFLQQSSIQKQKPDYIQEFEKAQQQLEQEGSPDFIVSPTTYP